MNIDWRKLISDLRDDGMTQSQIAIEMGCSQSFISEIESGKKGQRLSFALGNRLTALHAARCLASRREVAP